MKRNTNSIAQGYHHYRSSNPLDHSGDNKTIKMKITDYKYPKGYIPAIFILSVEVVILLIGFLVSSLKWYDVLLVTFIVGFCFNIIWLIFRQQFALQNKYNMSKFKDFITLKKKRATREFLNLELAKHNVNNYDDYVQFCEMRTKTSKLIFWISFGIQGCLALVAIIINLAMIF